MYIIKNSFCLILLLLRDMHRCLVFIDRLRIKLHREHELSGLTRSCILTSDPRLPNIEWVPVATFTHIKIWLFYQQQ